MLHQLGIYLGDRRVGTIANLENDRNVFTFDPQYLNDTDPPILSLGFYNAQRNLIAPTRVPHTRLLPYFSNLLPEGHLRRYLADQAGVNPQRDFPLLWLLGQDLPGAVTARHDAGQAEPPSDEVVPESIARDPKILKFSLAGVQLKFSAMQEPSGGLTIPVHGRGGQWIVKLPSATYDLVPENEYTMLNFAREVGIETPEIGLIESREVGNLPPQVRQDLGKALSIKRFDRDGERRIHIEDFAQVFQQYPDDKYKHASYANMLTGIWTTMGEEQAKEFIRRLVFSAAIGNADMHLKNWSIIYRNGKTPELSPAYDYLSTIAYIRDDTLALTIAGTREWRKIDDALLTRFARSAGVPKGIVLGAARDMADRVRQEWHKLNAPGLLPTRMVNDINAHLDSIPLFSSTRTYSTSRPGGLAANGAGSRQQEIA